MPFSRAIRTLGVAVAASLCFWSAAAGAAVPAWTTYNHDVVRSAIDSSGGVPVAPKPAWSSPAQLDGQIFAQPLVYGSRVYAVTEKDRVYALDAATGAIVWTRSVGTPVPATVLPCGNIKPTVGITSTPVIDPVKGRIYAVLDNYDGRLVQHRLVALDLATGSPAAGFPIPVDPAGADAKTLLQRAALTLDGVRIIIPYGGNAGDCGGYHGWLLSAPANGQGRSVAFQVTPGTGETGGAIWGSGDGPSLDRVGNVFVATGNGFGSLNTPDLQESVLEVSARMRLAAHWTPPNWKALDSTDLDLGSSEPLPLPNGLLFQIGKDGIGRLLSESALGTQGQLFSARVCTVGSPDRAFGASLYRAGVIYVPCISGVAALKLSNTSSPSFTALSSWSATSGAQGPPIFAGGLVWSITYRGANRLYGLDPSTGAVRFQTALGTFNHFATPSAAGGRLFMAVGSKVAALTIARVSVRSGRHPTP